MREITLSTFCEIQAAAVRELSRRERGCLTIIELEQTDGKAVTIAQDAFGDVYWMLE